MGAVSPGSFGSLLDDPLWDSRLLLLDTDRTDLTEQLARLLNDQPRQDTWNLIKEEDKWKVTLVMP